VLHEDLLGFGKMTKVQPYTKGHIYVASILVLHSHVRFDQMFRQVKYLMNELLHLGLLLMFFFQCRRCDETQGVKDQFLLERKVFNRQTNYQGFFAFSGPDQLVYIT